MVFVPLHVAVTPKVGRGRVVEDRRSRHCPYLDTINRQDVVTYVQLISVLNANESTPSWLCGSIQVLLVYPTGVCWTLTLKSSAPSPFPTSTSMLASFAGNTFKVGELSHEFPRLKQPVVFDCVLFYILCVQVEV